MSYYAGIKQFICRRRGKWCVFFGFSEYATGCQPEAEFNTLWAARARAKALWASNNP
jgi:hypothetical protein